MDWNIVTNGYFSYQFGILTSYLSGLRMNQISTYIKTSDKYVIVNGELLWIRNFIFANSYWVPRTIATFKDIALKTAVQLFASGYLGEYANIIAIFTAAHRELYE